jgi:hypothetical protein
MTDVAQILGQLFVSKQVMYFLGKTGWATLWAIFSQTRLVTLIENVLIIFHIFKPVVERIFQ